MINLALVVLCIGIVAIAAVKLTSVPTPGTVQAHAASLETDADPKINPAAMMRSAPHGLPQENWPLH